MCLSDASSSRMTGETTVDKDGEEDADGEDEEEEEEVLVEKIEFILCKIESKHFQKYMYQ